MRVHLSPELVDALDSPLEGERWVSDASLRGFGVRLWSGKKGGGACYAVRVRDQRGKIVRESFSIWSDWRARLKIHNLIDQDELELRLGLFLDEARDWARDKIRILKGGKSRTERRNELYGRISAAARRLTLAQVADRAFWKMEKSGRNPDYQLQLQKLFWRIPQDIRSSRLEAVDTRQLAREIAAPNLPVMQSRALQSFIGHLYARLYRWYGPVGQVRDELSRRISAIRRRQRVPHPKILKIRPAHYSRFLKLLRDENGHWREALALKLYFETGAKMRRILRARWDQIVGDTWYPYSESEREFWFVGRERLNESARRTLELARESLAGEGRASAYIFPRRDESGDRPITTVRRYWIRVADQMGWRGLPLSHVVLRHRPRNTPSYLYMYSYMWVPVSRQTVDPLAVSKFAKQVQANGGSPVA
jgi:hypothetical protein